MKRRLALELLAMILAPAVAHACAMALSSCDVMPCCDDANYGCSPLPMLGPGTYCVPRAAVPVASPQICACECVAPPKDDSGLGIDLWPGLGFGGRKDYAGSEPDGVGEGDTKEKEEVDSGRKGEERDNAERTDGLSVESSVGSASRALVIALGAGGTVTLAALAVGALLIFKAVVPQAGLISHVAVDLEAGSLGACNGSGGNGGSAERPQRPNRVQFDRLFEPRTDKDIFPECPGPDAAVGELPDLVLEGNEDGYVFSNQAENLDSVEEIPSGTPIHLSIAVDTSLLSCNANAVGGDNRAMYASGVANLLRVLAVPALGAVSTSIVAFAGDAAEVPEELADDPVFSDLAKLEKSLKGLRPPLSVRASGMHDRASPMGSMRAVTTCIELLRNQNPMEIQQRRVLVLTGGGISAPEMAAMRGRVRDGNGEAWKAANCVVVGLIGKQVDRAAGVQLGAVAVELNTIEEFGARETARVLARLFMAQNPRRAHIKAEVVHDAVPIGEVEEKDSGILDKR